MHADSHIPDDELLQALDGELAEPAAIAVRRHLSHCWECRARSGQLESAIAGFIELQRDSLGSGIPPAEGPAARLRAHMAASAKHARAARPPIWHYWPVFACSALAVIAFTAVISLNSITAGRRLKDGLPDPRLTPGATRLISTERVCALGDEGSPISPELANRVFRAYQVPQPRPNVYEVDYLITPALGGADDIRNLWPQIYEEGIWNARVKDALEDRLRNLVCSGQLDLATAQHEIAADWITAYRKYFRTERPLPAHALFIKDRPWQ